MYPLNFSSNISISSKNSFSSILLAYVQVLLEQLHMDSTECITKQHNHNLLSTYGHYHLKFIQIIKEDNKESNRWTKCSRAFYIIEQFTGRLAAQVKLHKLRITYCLYHQSICLYQGNHFPVPVKFPSHSVHAALFTSWHSFWMYLFNGDLLQMLMFKQHSEHQCSVTL